MSLRLLIRYRSYASPKLVLWLLLSTSTFHLPSSLLNIRNHSQSASGVLLVAIRSLLSLLALFVHSDSWLISIALVAALCPSYIIACSYPPSVATTLNLTTASAVFSVSTPSHLVGPSPPEASIGRSLTRSVGMALRHLSFHQPLLVIVSLLSVRLSAGTTLPGRICLPPLSVLTTLLPLLGSLIAMDLAASFHAALLFLSRPTLSIGSFTLPLELSLGISFVMMAMPWILTCALVSAVCPRLSATTTLLSVTPTASLESSLANVFAPRSK